MVSPAAAVLAGVLMAVWLAASAWALATGLAMQRRATQSADQLDQLSLLLEGAPASPVIVQTDDRIDVQPRLMTWLGLKRMPKRLSDLQMPDCGLLPDDFIGLQRDIAATRQTARPFERSIVPRGGNRSLVIRGEVSPGRLAGQRGVTLWVFDATETQSEIGQLRGDKARLARGFETMSSVLESAPFPIWHRGADLGLSLVNTAYVRAVEADSAEDVVRRGIELSDSVDGKAGAQEARDQGAAVARLVVATIAGERRSMRIVDVPLGDAGVAGYAIDVEEAELARAAFRRFAETQRDTLDRLSAAVAQFAPDHGLIFCNRPFQQLFALKPEWVAERPDFERLLDRMREARRVPETRDFPAWKSDKRRWFTHADGAIEESWVLPGGEHLRLVAQPLPDGGLLTIFEDRTEHAQLATARDTLLRVRRATLDNLFEAIGVFEASGRLSTWNTRFRDVWEFDEAFLLAHPRVDALVEAVAPKLSSPDRATLIRDLVRSATGERKQRLGRFELKNGRHYEFAAVPLPDGAALFTMLDITDSRQIEHVLRERALALEEADRIKTAFVANVSYELRTPLTSIQGFAEMLQGKLAGPISPLAEDYVSAILESTARLGALIDNVLDLTQGDAELVALERKPVDLAALLTLAAQDISARAATKSIDFAQEVSPELGMVAGDARRLRQAVDHLLINAIRYTQEGGRVLLHATGDVDRVRITISDNGPGMDAADQARALGRFSRGSVQADSDGQRALGIGLPLARHYVEGHGGALTLISELGVGTAVQIELRRT